MLRMLKFHILGLFLTLCFLPEGRATLAGESPYTRLRVQFLKAERPSLEDFHLGKPWYCSSSLEAAKGQFRYVSLWEHRYVWTPSGGGKVLTNQHEFYPMQLDLNILSGEYENLFLQPVVESFRVDEDGHLIVEVASYGSSFRNSRNSLSSSLVDESLTAQNYYLCMNPDWQSNDDWDYNRDQIFEADGQF
ncbi:MAG: hypothetical protein HRT45_12385 [Bdellovibrionales bacterium]|nr:hypothetical protein [Bdellovibrionales bacterium]